VFVCIEPFEKRMLISDDHYIEPVACYSSFIFYINVMNAYLSGDLTRTIKVTVQFEKVLYYGENVCHILNVYLIEVR
jgi:hypothetical protein